MEERGESAAREREARTTGGRERGMEMHGRETYESEAALRALRGISQVAVSPTASTGFRPPVAEQRQRQARTTSGSVEFTVLASFAAMPLSSYHLVVGTATPEKPVPATRFSPIKAGPKCPRLSEQIFSIFNINIRD